MEEDATLDLRMLGRFYLGNTADRNWREGVYGYRGPSI